MEGVNKVEGGRAPVSSTPEAMSMGDGQLRENELGPLQFAPWQSSVDVGFWEGLASQKLNNMRLKEDPVAITGFFAPCGYGQVSSHLSLTQESLPPQPAPSTQDDSTTALETASAQEVTRSSPATVWGRQRCPAPGLLRNTNTLESFRALDRPQLLRAWAMSLWQDILSGRVEKDPALLNSFLLLSFADLKKWAFYYWFAFPALVLPHPATAPPPIKAADLFSCKQIGSVASALDAWRSGKLAGPKAPPPPFFLLHLDASGAAVLRHLQEWHAVAAEGGEVFVVFYDPCHLDSHPGWPLRNLLALATARWKLSRLRVLCLRERHGRTDLAHCPVFDVHLPPQPEWEQGVAGDSSFCPTVVGWEKNLKGNMGPRLANMAPSMDPARLADAAADLNLKLMRWRLLPSLDVPKLAGTRCLLLGAGTLGCQVARGLMAWGVRKITLVDYGRVAMSNPLRQSLYALEDAVGGGKPKAEAAAASLKRIFPGVDATAIQLAIPMPGHPVSEREAESVAADCRQLADLVSSHDVVFQLMDTRESRWLPTLLCSSANKLAVNVALGFDTWLVMRHASRPTAAAAPAVRTTTEANAPSSSFAASSSSATAAVAPTSAAQPQPRLGCYFCNDVVAPLDSTANRTLDQQCTVTRPGVAPIAAATAVELMVTLLHHPCGVFAPADMSASVTASTETPLGLVPHQIRGFMGHFSQLIVTGAAFDKCTACSATVVEKYREEGFGFLMRVFNEPKYLEDLTGLTAMLQATKEVDLDWDSEEEEDVGDMEEKERGNKKESSSKDEDFEEL